MKRDPIQKQKEELAEYQQKYNEADPTDYRREIYQKEIEIRKQKIDCTIIRQCNTQEKIMDFNTFSRIYGYR